MAQASPHGVDTTGKKGPMPDDYPENRKHYDALPKGASDMPYSHEEDALIEHALKHARAGDAQHVLDVVDEFCNSGHWHMNIGPEKGAVLDSALREKRPAVSMEWGGYLGYSAIRIGRLVQQWGGRLISCEYDPQRVQRASRLIKHAGLENVVSFKAGPASHSLPLIAKELGPGKLVDLIFLDHVKDIYLSDLLIAQKEGLVGKGTVLVADNVIFPGCPDYLLYVRDSKNGYTSKHYSAHLEYSSAIIDGIEVSVKQF